MVYGILALCSGSSALIPENIEIPEFYSKIFNLNRGLILSIGVFFVVGGFFLWQLKSWARSLLLSSAWFRIVWLLISLGLTFKLLSYSEYKQYLETEIGSWDIVLMILILLAIFILEALLPVVLIIILSNQKVKALFKPEKPSPPHEN